MYTNISDENSLHLKNCLGNDFKSVFLIFILILPFKKNTLFIVCIRYVHYGAESNITQVIWLHCQVDVLIDILLNFWNILASESIQA